MYVHNLLIKIYRIQISFIFVKPSIKKCFREIDTQILSNNAALKTGRLHVTSINVKKLSKMKPKFIAIETGNFKLDGGAMFGVVPKSIWNKNYPSDENNLCNWAMRCMLYDDGTNKVLVDTGIGNKQDAKFMGHYYLNGDASLLHSLALAGYKPEDITHVLLTHLHFDHCGGAVYRNEAGLLKTTFPNAVYWVSKKQWEWANNPNGREKASFLPENFKPIEESGQLVLVHNENYLLPNLRVRFFDGHTDGQMLPFFEYNNKTLVYMADMLPSSAHLPMPYIMSYDTRPLLTLDERKWFYEEAAQHNYTLFLEHDLHTQCMQISKTDKSYQSIFNGNLTEVIF